MRGVALVYEDCAPGVPDKLHDAVRERPAEGDLNRHDVHLLGICHPATLVLKASVQGTLHGTKVM